MTDTVLYECTGHVATITYNRPEALNAVNGELRRDLNAAFARFRDEEEAWVGIVTGAGRAFCAGADLRDGAGSTGEFAGTFWEKPTLNSFESGWEIHKPVIAAVNGHCLGYGLTLVTWCDFVLASERATLRLSRGAPRRARHGGGHPPAPDASPGPTPWSCCSPESPSTPSGRARWGSSGASWRTTTFSTRPGPWPSASWPAAPLAQRAMKEMAARARDLSALDAIRFGETMRSVVAATADAAEGMAAAAERRPPRWTGR